MTHNVEARSASIFEPDFARAVFALLIDRMAWKHGAPNAKLLWPDALGAPDDGAVMWGLGLAGPADGPRGVDVRAVRGPWTANALAAQGLVVPKVFGDAASLLPRYIPELRDAAGRRGIKTPLILETTAGALDSGTPAGTVATPAADSVLDTLRAIAQSSLLVTSSVSAIAIAESLNIPARFFADRMSSRFSQRDYLLGTGRPFARISESPPEALAVGGYPAPRVDLDALARAFPLSETPADGAEGASAVPPDRYAISDQNLAAWRSTVHRVSTPSDAREFARKLSERLDQARCLGDERLVDEIGSTAEHLAIVDPDLAACAVGQDSRLLTAVSARNVGRVLAALALRDSALVVGLTSTRRLSDELLVGVAMAGGTDMAEWPEVVALRLESLAGARRVEKTWHLFDQQRLQWRLDLDYLIPLEEIDGVDQWRVSIVLGDSIVDVTTGTPRDLHDPRSEAGNGSQVIISVSDLAKVER